MRIFLLLIGPTFLCAQNAPAHRGIRNYYTGKVSLGFENLDEEPAYVEYTGGVDFEDKGAQQVVPTRGPPRPATHIYGTSVINKPTVNIEETSYGTLPNIKPKVRPSGHKSRPQPPPEPEPTTPTPATTTETNDQQEEEEFSTGDRAPQMGQVEIPPELRSSFGIFGSGGGRSPFGEPEKEQEEKKETEQTTLMTTTTAMTEPPAKTIPTDYKSAYLNTLADRIEQQMESKETTKRRKRKHRKRTTKAITTTTTEASTTESEDELRRRAEEEVAALQREKAQKELAEEENRLKKLEDERLRELEQKRAELERLQKEIQKKKEELLRHEHLEKEMLRKKTEEEQNQEDSREAEMERAKEELREKRRRARLQREKLRESNKSKPNRRPVVAAGSGKLPSIPDSMRLPVQHVEVEPPAAPRPLPSAPSAQRVSPHSRHSEDDAGVEESDGVSSILEKAVNFVAKITPHEEKDENEDKEDADEEIVKAFGLRTKTLENEGEKPEKPTGFATLKVHKAEEEEVEEESYLGGWGEVAKDLKNEGVRLPQSTPMTADGPKMGRVQKLSADEKKRNAEVARAFYEEYYREWYANHTTTEAATPKSTMMTTSSSPSTAESAAPQAFIPDRPPAGAPFMNPFMSMMGGAMPMMGGAMQMGAQAPRGSSGQNKGNMFGIIDPRLGGQGDLTPEQLNRLCTDIYGVSKAFGINDVKGFASNNCGFITAYYSNATCEQIMHVMEYCEAYFQDRKSG